MDQSTLIIFAIALLAALCIGAIGFLFVGRETQSQKRVARVARAGNARLAPAADDEVDNSEKRRKQMQETLKSLEEKQAKQKKSIPVKTRIERAGLEIEMRTFYLASAVCGLTVMLFMMLSGLSFFIALLGGFAAAFGLPRWVLSFLMKRRQNAFAEEFANTIDVIVRGVKSGLPVNDCLKLIATESPEPIRSEFQGIVEGQRVGVTLEQGLEKIYERMPLPEVNFFQIVLAIQQKTGGNLSEALSNLSKVLRERKKMRAKIQAMSQEAKASAGIIGSLPPGVMLMIYFVSPEYMNVLFTTTAGNIIIVAGLLWMSIGVLVMKKMIDFKF
ncbi:type II secretion system F family protein [Parvibaculum sp.]|jgi:tight adherence protein B|uniref:type II secretion system F family protein n=1 Tax=Parvibaculum sp. TaxID=2024848 RepID=UPI000C53166D|nr:type II secretion system F family protein [Parvibaculum sp.]HAC59544.1 pilus assembly protein [Rhodobiaceae bacterium]MAU61613.1 pilus assembly protein [Parvibaculum sp.]MAU62507.1 pilus assembly protein [Parvibaculum sp.]MBO6666552.1 type II secretion system F family protein [Parvibaculum sp.]MBO6690853.1 type II secretion system F family protein [Parvibaculum sp.]|tara:strand:+ start:1336 stop:2325 length:990 start_codon:yes stop_codon:yes gene_type:complete